MITAEEAKKRTCFAKVGLAEDRINNAIEDYADRGKSYATVCFDDIYAMEKDYFKAIIKNLRDNGFKVEGESSWEGSRLYIDWGEDDI